MIRISEYVRNTQNEDGGVVLDVRHGRLFALNVVGSRIVELLKKDCREAGIAHQISQEFGVSLEIATADVREFLLSLQTYQLVEHAEVLE
jgi:hypothetical protein